MLTLHITSACCVDVRDSFDLQDFLTPVAIPYGATSVHTRISFGMECSISG